MGRKVQLYRKNWKPTSSSLLCSAHFKKDEENFFSEDLVRERLGLPRNGKRKLKETAVPTIFNNRQQKTAAAASSTRALAKKRERQRILEDIAEQNENMVTVCETPSASHEENMVENCQKNEFRSSKELEAAAGLLELFTCPHRNATREFGCQVNILVKHRSVGQQAQVKVKDVGIQKNPEMITQATQTDPSTEFPSLLHQSDDWDVDDDDDDDNDDDSDMEFLNLHNDDTHSCWSMESDESSVMDDTCPNQKKTHEHRKFIVFEENSLSLFSSCPTCHNPSTVQEREWGTYLKIHQKCATCGYQRQWQSQPILNKVPAGNFALSASILYAGASPTKVLRVFSFLNCAAFDERTYMLHQKRYLIPAVCQTYASEQAAHIETIRGQHSELVAAADGRCDSPGHSAKFGALSLLDLKNNKILNVELIQSNEVSSSNAIELEALKRTLDWLAKCNISLRVLVTDRHIQIRAYLQRCHTEIVHLLDVWHIAKGLKKKLHALSLKKDMEIIGLWAKSINNHIYYCASSVKAPNTQHEKEENGKNIEKRWKSIMFHVRNDHKEHGDIPACAHKPLGEKASTKIWIDPKSEAYRKLEDVLMNQRTLKDLKAMSPLHQTSNLESYHSVINHFAPKMLGYSYDGMKCRLQLATLHFNENSGREKRPSKGGGYQYRIEFPKYKKDFRVKHVLVPATFHYVKKLMHLTEELVLGEKVTVTIPPPPPPVTSTYVHPNKTTDLEMHRSRFQEETDY